MELIRGRLQMDSFIWFGTVYLGLKPASILQLVAFLAEFRLHEYFPLSCKQLRLAKVRRIHGDRPFQDFMVPVVVVSLEQERVSVRLLPPKLLLLVLVLLH